MSNAIATREQDAEALGREISTISLATDAGFTLMQRQARLLVSTGFLPSSIKTPEQAIAIMMKGRELRVPEMYALSNIVVVNGKPSCSAELMLGLIRRDHGPQSIRVGTTTNDACTVQWRQPGWPDIQEYTFTIQDAERAGLFKNAVWKQYPAAMLRARCISAVARMAFPECIAGMYSPDELGAAVAVTGDGDVVFAGTHGMVNEDGESFPLIDDATNNEWKARHEQESEIRRRQEQYQATPPPTVVEQPPQQSAREREAAAHEAAMKRLHAVGRDKGADHDDLHLLMAHRFDIRSLKDASAQMLEDFATVIEDLDDGDLENMMSVALAAKGVVDVGAQIEAEYLAKIEAAQSQDALSAIAREMGENGVGTDALRAAHRTRLGALRDGGELAGMPPDVSRYAEA